MRGGMLHCTRGEGVIRVGVCEVYATGGEGVVGVGVSEAFTTGGE